MQGISLKHNKATYRANLEIGRGKHGHSSFPLCGLDLDLAFGRLTLFFQVGHEFQRELKVFFGSKIQRLGELGINTVPRIELPEDDTKTTQFQLYHLWVMKHEFPDERSIKDFLKQVGKAFEVSSLTKVSVLYGVRDAPAHMPRRATRTA